MANISHNSLNILLNLASEAEEEAAKAMAKSKKALDEAEGKGEMLRGYRQDYVNNLSKLLEKGLGKETHMNYQNFLKKLDQAISGQEELVTTAQYEYKNSKVAWQETQRKKLSYEILLKREKKKEHHLALKKDQKIMDEFASRPKRARLA